MKQNWPSFKLEIIVPRQDKVIILKINVELGDKKMFDNIRIPHQVFFTPMFLRTEILPRLQELGIIHYDSNTDGGNIGVWLGDLLETLTEEQYNEISEFFIFPDNMRDEFRRAQILGEIPPDRDNENE